MRGGAQSHLVEASDGQYYVLKPKNNPQHRRILVNEWLVAALARYLEIEAAPAELIEVTPEFVGAHPEFAIQLGSKRIPVEPGWHFGSRFPGDPAKLAVFDFLPDVLLMKVANLADFRSVLVLDKWTANADARQAVFFRAKFRQEGGEGGAERTGFLAWMIDHGFAFGGPNWEFVDAPLYGLYHRAGVYEGVTGLESFEPSLSRVEDCPEEVVDRAWRDMPLEWLEDGDEAELQRVVERLLARRGRIRHLLEDARRGAKASLFPRWRL
jgi:hypothetical protein